MNWFDVLKINAYDMKRIVEWINKMMNKKPSLFKLGFLFYATAF